MSFDKNISPLEELQNYITPPGKGIYTVSTGAREAEDFLSQYMPDLDFSWKTHLQQELLSQKHKVAFLGVPSDSGAGIIRGAAQGPNGIRKYCKKLPFLDLGNIFTIPHYLYDELLCKDQINATRRVIYGSDDNNFPVSPLSICKRVYDLLKKIQPELKIFLLGGDHSVTWPVMDSLLEGDLSDLAIVHFDAHTDMLEERLGVKYCFATWAYHANERLNRGQRLLQLGIRASSRDKKYWESNYDVKQYWAHEIRDISPKDLTQLVLNHLDSLGTKRVYISNDIDGTDSKWASACGTPEKEGLNPDQIVAVIEALKKYEIIGADLVEVAPVLSLDKKLSEKTLHTAQRYIQATALAFS